ncbi:MAG: hypothetical protein KAX38_07520 [Candidatus Krumholzibacteria bacterium]|nr:hypothetical protein [Candidatus Krumholzibacteria bacterium]
MIWYKMLLHRSHFATVCAVTAFVSFCPSPATAEARNSVTLGYDSFIDRFTILEKDTLETVQEFYAGLSNDLSLRRGSVKTGLRSLFRYGNQTIDETLDGELSIGKRRSTKIDLRSTIHWKHFQEGSDYTFGNDYVQSNTRLKIKKEVDGKYTIGFKSRFEAVDYRERTDFDYDYTYFDAGLDIEKGSYFKKLIRLGAFVGFKEAPDTTALSYRRTVTAVEIQLSTRENTSIHLAVTGDRRNYRENVRSSYWNVITYTDLTVNSISGRRYSLKAESELTFYDEPSTTFFGTHFLRVGFRAKFPIHGLSALFVEPRYARMFCGDFEEERYWEGSMILGIDILGSSEFWLTLSYEPGYRDYITENNELYSDFYLNRLSLMGSCNFPGDVTLNLFATHDPERHARRDDDFSITLISTYLTKRF